MGESPLHRLADHGQSVWLDSLSRAMLREGELERMMREDAIVGVTSNPTIFQQAIAGSDAYDEQVVKVLEETSDEIEMYRRLFSRDVIDACDLLRPVWEQTAGRDGYVSLEVDPRLAYESEETYERVKILRGLVDRPNLLVKIPATKPGLPAIENSITEGRSINVTLIFSLGRYAEVAEAYIRGLERLVAAGGEPGRVASVASFFVSRVDTEADRRLEEIGTEEALALRGKLAVANAKLAYRHYKEAFSGERWELLASRGASTQRCLWASTSAKNPAYSDVVYVEELTGPETVNTMPLETIRAFQDHGRPAPTLELHVDEARRLLEDLSRVGVDYDEVTETLEKEGVQKFVDSFEQLLAEIRAKRGQLVAT